MSGENGKRIAVSENAAVEKNIGKDCFLGHNMMHESRRDFQGNPKSRVEKPIDGHKYCDIMTQFPM